MAWIARHIWQGQPHTSEDTLASPVGGKQWIIKEILICNTTTAAATISISVIQASATPTASDTNRICKNLSVDPNTTVRLGLSTVVDVGGFLSAVQGTAGAVTLTVSGVEQ